MQRFRFFQTGFTGLSGLTLTKSSCSILSSCQKKLIFSVLLVNVATAWSVDTSTDPGCVVWDTPSADSNGTMPLGNGEVALNAWIEPSGDLRFFIARTDAWDEYGRLLKVGGVRVRIGDGGAERTKVFRQTLTVQDGTLRATYGEGAAQVELRLWVDANRPVIVVEATSAQPTVASTTLELWRTNEVTLAKLQCSDVLNGCRDRQTVTTRDTVLTGLADRIGWYHRNEQSVGPDLCGKIQGMAGFARPDPLLHRTFGAVIATDRAARSDDRTLGSTSGTRHVFEIAVHTLHPATAEKWQADTADLLNAAHAVPLAERRKAHEAWWSEFWGRSCIRVTQNGLPVERPEGGAGLPTNALPLSIGMNSKGGSRFNAAFGRVSVYEVALKDADIAALAALPHDQPAAPHAARLFSGIVAQPQALSQLAGQTFANGFTVEAWIKSDNGFKGDGRIADKETPGGADGFLFDTHPGDSLRLIVGGAAISHKGVLKSGIWQHVAAVIGPSGVGQVFLNGKALGGDPGSVDVEGDDASAVSRGYTLQRFISACAGRGRYPIKYNGSLFTVPFDDQPEYADYRRWGPGYWWQNTREPYYSMCAAGDFDLLEPLFQMYARDLLPQFTYRTKRYLNHAGAYIPECIYFWGDMFSETYGWQPCDERADKLQASRWHKWEWVSGLELSLLLLDRYAYTGDAEFLRKTALPCVREILTFFDQQYQVGADGKLVMHPAQACETWWECTNPMPELAGLYAVTESCLALPEKQTTADERAFWQALRAKLPALPTMQNPGGKTQLAPAQAFKQKSNCENPELYAVFPFRQFGLGRPNMEWAVEALNRRGDRGPFGWRQEDVFMAYLGQTAAARDYVVRRARKKCGSQRFPAFWGPNYDWTPDQCHGGILLKAVQSLLLQTDGRKIYLLPAWPRDWDCEFKLHAPLQTVVTGTVKNGKLIAWDVTPAERKADVVVMP